MRLAELKLRGILDGDHALRVRDERGEDVQCRGLPRAGATGNQDVEVGLDAGFEEPGRFRRERAEVDQVLHRVGIARELSNGERRAVDRQRRNDRVDPRAVRKAAVHHR